MADARGYTSESNPPARPLEEEDSPLEHVRQDRHSASPALAVRVVGCFLPTFSNILLFFLRIGSSEPAGDRLLGLNEHVD